MAERSPTQWWPLVLLGALVVTGLAVPAFDLDWRAALELVRSHAGQWWVAPALVLLQVLLFAFGLPGSAVLWLVAPLYAPAVATVILTTGGCAGALAAYGFARRLSGASLVRLQASRGYRMLQREGDLLLLCALRLAPGVPHSVLNYAAGVLRLPLAPFLVAAAVGFAVKAYLYSRVIHRALAAGRPADLLAWDAVWPLLAVALVVVAARAALRRR